MNILVTGASRGIGYELVKAFYISGMHSIIAVSRNEKKLGNLYEECSGMDTGSELKCIPFDLSDTTGIEQKFAHEVTSHFTTLDVMVNNAGHLVRKPFEQMREEDFRACMDVNYMAPLMLIRSLLPFLKKSDKAHVVNIGSMAGVEGSKKFPGLSAYSVSKGAVHILTECLAEEYSGTGIVFNALALGSVRTEMLEEAFPGLKAPVTAEEMARLIADFAVNGRKYYNGKVIQVSGTTP
jgi:NAD(P)-dependent dehydrogenase (short-subunit alcohol dehydrogenase family)